MASTRSLTDRTADAAQWRLGGALFKAVLQFGIGALLARLLTPADFGLVALAFIVLGLTSLLGDLGMAGAVVQREELTERHVRSAFTFSVLLGAALAGIIILGAPLGAVLMDEPRLTGILQVLSVGFVLRGYSVVAGGLLRRQLDFERMFYVDFASYLVGYAGVAVALALLGFGVWSLVWGGLVQQLLSTALLLHVVRHPVRPLVAWDALRDLLGFGTGMTLNGFVNYAATNGDSFVIGRWLGADGLGLYSRAYALMQLPQTYTASIISSVLFPALSKVQKDKRRLRRGYLLATRLTALSAAPVMAGMAVAAPHLIEGIYGPGWEGTIVPLQILCLAGYFRALYHLGGSVTHASGHIYQELGAQIGYAVIVLGGSALALPYGINGVAVAVTLAIVYMYIVMAFLSSRIAEVGARNYLNAQRSGVTVGLIVGAFAYGVRMALEWFDLSSLVIAIVLVGVCGAVWIWSLLIVIHSPELQLAAEKIPPRLRGLATFPPRIHRELASRNRASASHVGPIRGDRWGDDAGPGGLP